MALVAVVALLSVMLVSIVAVGLVVSGAVVALPNAPPLIFPRNGASRQTVATVVLVGAVAWVTASPFIKVSVPQVEMAASVVAVAVAVAPALAVTSYC